jgi:hypothetical protein
MQNHVCICADLAKACMPAFPGGQHTQVSAPGAPWQALSHALCWPTTAPVTHLMAVSTCCQCGVCRNNMRHKWLQQCQLALTITGFTLVDDLVSAPGTEEVATTSQEEISGTCCSIRVHSTKALKEPQASQGASFALSSGPITLPSGPLTLLSSPTLPFTQARWP